MDWPHLLQLSLHFDQYLGDAIAQYGMAVYIMLFAVVFCEIGVLPLFFLPGDPLLFICGAYCASGAISIWIVVPLLFAATVAGSVVNYWIGTAIGHKAFTADYRWLNKAALGRTHAFYEHHGGVTFLLSPFIAVVRTFAPFVGGIADMTFARFLAFIVAGAALWVFTMVAGGYFFGNVPVIRDHMSTIILLGVGIGVGSLAVSAGWRYLTPSKARP